MAYLDAQGLGYYHTKVKELIENAASNVEDQVDDLKNIIKVSSTQPTEPENKLWISSGADTEVEIPTYDEFTEVKSAFEASNAALAQNDIIVYDWQDIGTWVDNSYIYTNVSVGATVDVTPINSNSFTHAIVSVSKGDILKVEGTGGNNPRLWAFTDSEYKLLDKASYASGHHVEEFTAKSDGFLIVNSGDGTSIVRYIKKRTANSPIREEVTDLKESINGVTYFPENIAYVTNGVSDTHYGVTYAKSGNNVISLYGASTGSGFFHVFNGANSYSNYGPVTPTVNLTEGYYTVYFDRSRGSWPILCYTESTYADRYEVISGQTIHVGENGGALFLRISSSVDYGTQDNPTLCTLSVYKGINTSRYDTAIDVIARETAGYTDSPYYKGAFGTYKADFAKFYTGKNEDYTTGSLGRSTKYSEVISLFDALMAMDTAYVSKNSLGTASGTDEGGNAYTLYEYVFTANAYKPDGLAAAAVLKKNPVILCDAAIHGFEKNSTYGLYYFLYDLVNNYADDPVLSAIRENVTIKVIPVSNPYGFDNNSYTNGNDVNINRNFYESKWAPDEEDATGEEPFDQPESVIIRDWVLANQRDLMAYFNMHTNGQYSAVSFSEANALMPKFKRSNNDPYYNRLAYIIQRHVQMQTNKFRDMYSLDISGFFGKYQGENNSVGTASVWATEQAKVVSMTFEMFNGISIDGASTIPLFSADSKKICSELIGNMIAQTIFEYSDR